MPIARPYAAISRHGMRGGLITSTSGTAAKKKRSPASAKGGNSRKPILIGMNEKPSKVTRISVKIRSRGARAFFMPAGAAPRPCVASFESPARRCGASQLDYTPGLQRFAQGERDSRRFGRVVQRQRRREIIEHGVDKMRRLAQECLLEPLVERRRAFVAHSVRIGNVDAIDPGVLADGKPASGTEYLGRCLMPVRHGPRGVEARHLAVGEFARRDAVVDVAELTQPLVQR